MDSRLNQSSIFLCVLASLLLGSSAARAHGIAMDQLILRADFTAHELRGQITFDPHHTRQDNRAGDAAIEPKVLGAIAESLGIEIDGARCAPRFELRELWAPAGATVGDIVSVSCPLAAWAHEMRVFAGPSLNALVVSIESAEGDGRAESRSVLVRGGTFTPPYRFGEAARQWREGGANQFLPDGGLASQEVGVPRASAETTGFEQTSFTSLALRYLRLGFEHILPRGWDHVLFVAGLVLGSSKRLKSLLLELSAFTLAHTLTLGLGALGWVVLPARVVEPLIAFSIAYVAIENLWGKSSGPRRLLLVLGFGLLHGQGFASALAGTGLPQRAFLSCLLSFNLGVELGQLVVVLLLVAMLGLLRDEQAYRRYAVRPGSLAIAVVGSIWGVQRLLSI